jgi:hypothetical protein
MAQDRSIDLAESGAAVRDVDASLPAPGRRTRTASLRGGVSADEVVQRMLQYLGAAPARDADAHEVAASGLSGGGEALPHFDAVQRAFGRHDVSGVRAHVGGAAASAAEALGARAYASGDQVAFADRPDLFLVAHEAAHVVQQRGGVQLSGGVGEAGDVYEQHADAVAAAVVRGESAEALLDRRASASGTLSRGVQRDDGPLAAPQAQVGAAGSRAVQLTPRQTPHSHGNLDYETDPDPNATGDPEERRGGLPFTERGWNAEEILSHLTQIDSQASTETDLHRCGAASVLAIHIQAGPDATARTAERTHASFSAWIQANQAQWDDATRARRETARAAVGAVAGRIRRRSAGYGDLQQLANAIKLVAPSGTGPTVNEDFDTYRELGGGGQGSRRLRAFVGGSHTGVRRVRSLAEALGRERNQGFILGVNIDERETRTDHAVSFGANAEGRVYLYDPWPRRGSQLLYWPSPEIDDYFQGADGRARRWQVRELFEGDRSRG